MGAEKRGGSASGDDLSARIDAARRAQEPKPGGQMAAKYNALSLAWRMALELVVGAMLGFGIGFGLDRLFGTAPLFLIVFLLLGFAAGVRTVMATAEEASKMRDDGDGGR